VARRQAKMKKREQERSTPQADHILAQYHMQSKGRFYGKYQLVLNMTKSKINMLKLSKNQYEVDWSQEFQAKTFNAKPVPQSPNDDEVVFSLMGKKKVEEKIFMCVDRESLLTDIHWQMFQARELEPRKFSVKKYTRRHKMRDAVLAVGGGRISQVDPASGRTLSAYLLKDIKAITLVDDEGLPSGFTLQRKHRVHLYCCDQRDQLIEKIVGDANSLIGYKIPEPQVDSRSLEALLEHRHEVSYADVQQGAMYFDVYKRTLRHSAPIQRKLCISSGKLAELDGETNGVVAIRLLATVFAVVSEPDESQWVTIEFIDGSKLNYMCRTREAMIACMLDTCAEGGNTRVMHRLEPTEPSWTYGPKWSLLEAKFEKEYFHANLLSPKTDERFLKALTEFSVQNLMDAPVAGQLLESLLMPHSDGRPILSRCNDPEQVNVVISTLQTMQSLVQLTSGFVAFEVACSKSGGAAQLAGCLASDDEDLRVQTLLLMYHAVQPIERDPEAAKRAAGADVDARDIRATVFVEGSKGAKIDEMQINEAVRKNKGVLMDSQELRNAMTVALEAGLRSESGHLVVRGVMEMVNLYILGSNNESTKREHYDGLLSQLAGMEGLLFQLLFHPSMIVMKRAGLLLETITRDSSAEQAAKMQKIALKEGAFLKQFYLSLFSENGDQQILSRRLVSMFADNFEQAMDLLMQMFPRGLLHFLKAARGASAKEMKSTGPRSKEEIMRQKQEKAKMLKREQESAVAAETSGTKVEYTNWGQFYAEIAKDYNRGDLMWNDVTRKELKDAMEAEISALGLNEQATVLQEAISWNYLNFEVRYPSLEAEPRIGNLYLMRLLEKRKRGESVEKRLLEEIERDGNPERFFSWAHERFLYSHDDNTKALCLQVMAIVYKNYHTKLPLFRAMPDIVEMVDFTLSRKVRDNLLVFIQVLLYEQMNAKAFMNAGGIQLITELMSLVHWDDSIKIAAADLDSKDPVMMLEDSKEAVREPATYWFYKVPKGYDSAGTEVGPLSMTSLEQLYREGKIKGDTEMHTKDDWEWRALSSFRCLRWRFMMKGSSTLSPVEAACNCVDIMLTLCKLFPLKDSDGVLMKPLPQAREILSDMKTVLPHIVQLLITQQPTLIERAAELVSLIVDENKGLQRKLYRTGLFCFAFMYQGSNVMPLVQLVKNTHTLQQFQGFEDALQMNESNIVKKSILSTIFPDSLVLYLHHRTAKDFTKTYLGENDTPELIWTQGMRDKLMTELAQHTADFAWQLREYPMSIYDYEPVPAIAFEELKEEIWLHTVYLKNLADTDRFPDWGIDEPVELLRALLTYWKSLLKTDPNAMNDEESFKILNCEPGSDAAKLKKSYRKMAIKYHPDKNPDGHDMFQKIQKAYEHLTSKKGVGEEKNQSHGIKLVLRAHVCLYRQHWETLSPYKYAGYPMLLDVLRGVSGMDMFQGDGGDTMNHGLMTVLLTMRSSRANGNEFCRMSGIYALDAILAQCVDVMTPLTKDGDPVAQLTTIVVQTYALLMEDKEFLENGPMYHNKGFHNKYLVRTIAHCLKFVKATELVRATVACMDFMAVIPELQIEMHTQGALWTMLPLLFQYDSEQMKAEPDYAYTPFSTASVHDEIKLTELQLRDSIARETARCLMRLAGLGGGPLKTKACKIVAHTLVTLLGPLLVSKLKGQTDFTEFLDLINDHVETPEMIWSRDHEKELIKKCEEWTEDIEEGEGDPDCALGHVYKASETELVVRSIYVRVQVKKTDSEGFVADTKAPEVLFQRLCQWCIDPAKVPRDVMNVTRGEHTPENLAVALRCIEQMLTQKKDRAAKIHEHKSSVQLFSFLKPDKWPGMVHQQALKVLVLCCKQPKVIEDVIANYDALTPLLCLLKAGGTAVKALALTVIQLLTANAKILAECIKRGAVIYLLTIVGSPDALSEQSREVLTGMSKNALHGLKVVEAMEQFLPGAVVNGLIHGVGEDEFKFTAECKTPELIWNDGMASQFRAAAAGQMEQLYTAQVADPKAKPELDEDFQVEYEGLYEEVSVGGIYLRLFLQNPQYNIRKPEKFVEVSAAL
jgi:DnaJ family protein C protein 13